DWDRRDRRRASPGWDRRVPVRPGRNASLATLRLARHFVGARGHDEVVAVQALDRMAPPGDGDLAPLGEQTRVVALGFGDLADGIGEGQRVLEVLEQEGLLQLHVAVAGFDVPVGDLLDQLGQFVVADFRRIGAAGFAMGLGEGGHGVVLVRLIRVKPRRVDNAAGLSTRRVRSLNRLGSVGWMTPEAHPPIGRHGAAPLSDIGGAETNAWKTLRGFPPYAAFGGNFGWCRPSCMALRTWAMMSS